MNYEKRLILKQYTVWTISNLYPIKVQTIGYY
jgi:hypothetical protein